MRTANDNIREQLKDIRAQLAAARDERAAAQQAVDQAKEAFQSSGKELSDVNSPEFKAAQDAVEKLGNIKDKIEDLQLAERGALQLLGQSTGEPAPPRGEGDRLAQTARDLLAREGSPYQAAREAGIFDSKQQFGSVVLGQVADRTQVVEFLNSPQAAIGSGVGGVGAMRADRRGFIPPLLKPLSLLDLIPVGTTDAQSVDYVQITAVPTGAVETAELAAKPELGLTTVDANAPVRTIAGYVKLARQALDDVAGLSALIDLLLPYEVRRRVEAQILAGDGVGQNIRGLLNTSGVGAPAFVAGDNPADAILRAMTTVIMSDGEPNFAALNPLTWQDVRLLREVGGSSGTREGTYIMGAPSEAVAPTLWGLTLTANRVVPQATPLVGDAMGCMILVREGLTTRVSDSDQDDFTRNRVTVLAETRIAFPVWRPASFAVADFTV